MTEPVGCNDSAVRWLRAEADMYDAAPHAHLTPAARQAVVDTYRHAADELERGADRA